MPSINLSAISASVRDSAPAPLQIPAAMRELNDALEMLENTVTTLASRLQPVVVPAPAEGMATAKSTEAVSELAMSISDRADSVRYVSSRLQDLLAGLQI